MVSDFLAHHGVKGMKWGRRKAGSGAASSHVKRTEPHEDHKSVKALRKEKTKTLGNDEIQKINKRLQLEKSYSELANQTSVISKGQKKAAIVLGVAATAQTAYAFSKSPLGQTIKKQLVGALAAGARGA